MPRRRSHLNDGPPETEQVTHTVLLRHDPAELKFYVKQLTKALRYLPLGSRAYYAISGEILRANRELKNLLPVGSPSKGPAQRS